MAKDKERKLAKKLYMQGKTGKDIANIVNVEPKTISNWAIKYGWKAEREARVNSTTTEVTNLRTILSDITEKKIENMRDIELARKSKDQDKLDELYGVQRRIADEYSKWNKRLREIEGQDKVELATYIHVMEELFKAIQKYDPKLFMKLLDFQEQHLEDISLKFSMT